MNTVRDDEVYSPVSNFRKSNTLIRGRYSAGLLENKLLSVSLANCRNTENNRLKATLNKAQIKKLLGTESHRYYEQLKYSANKLLGSVIFAEDPESKKFRASVLVTDVEWDSKGQGEFSVYFNETFRNEILDLKSNYTTLNIDCIFKLETTGAFRLYETLLSHCYYGKEFKGERNGKFDIDFSISELRCMLNLIDLSREEFSQFFEGNQSPDYDKIVQFADYLHDEDVSKNKPKKDTYPSPKYKTANDLLRKIIKPAAEEISDKTDLNVEFEPIKSGKGAKVTGVIFHVINKNYVKTEPKKNNVEFTLDAIDLIDEELQSNFSMKDIKLFFRDAEGDVNRINKAYKVLKNTPNVKNQTGFMRKAIVEIYDEPVEMSNNGSKKGSFYFKDGGEYDYDSIEEIIS